MDPITLIKFSMHERYDLPEHSTQGVKGAELGSDSL